MKHTVAIPPGFPKLDDLRSFIEGRHRFDTFDFVEDDNEQYPKCKRSNIEADFVMRNTQTGELIGGAPFFDEINATIDEFLSCP